MISKFFLLLGIFFLGLYGFFTVQARMEQDALKTELEDLTNARVLTAEPAPPAPLKEGDLFGRLEIPRLDLSVMVLEGDSDGILRVGAGHVPGAPVVIAAHRDSYFRPLRNIKPQDTIRLTTPTGTTEYRVASTRIVDPHDTSVLDNESPDTLTLITCYPFYYIGPAPKRFIVEAKKD